MRGEKIIEKYSRTLCFIFLHDGNSILYNQSLILENWSTNWWALLLGGVDRRNVGGGDGGEKGGGGVFPVLIPMKMTYPFRGGGASAYVYVYGG